MKNEVPKSKFEDFMLIFLILLCFISCAFRFELLAISTVVIGMLWIIFDFIKRSFKSLGPWGSASIAIIMLGAIGFFISAFPMENVSVLFEPSLLVIMVGLLSFGAMCLWSEVVPERIKIIRLKYSKIISTLTIISIFCFMMIQYLNEIKELEELTISLHNNVKLFQKYSEDREKTIQDREKFIEEVMIENETKNREELSRCIAYLADLKERIVENYNKLEELKKVFAKKDKLEELSKKHEELNMKYEGLRKDFKNRPIHFNR